MASIWNASKDPAIRELKALVDECEEKGVEKGVIKKINGVIDIIELKDKYSMDVSTQPSEEVKMIMLETQGFPFQKCYEEGKTEYHHNPIMVSGHIEGIVLQALLSMCGATRVLEIATFTGHGALVCAEVLPEHGTVVTLEIDPFLHKLARQFVDKSPHGKKIDIRLGPAQQTLAAMKAEKVQFDVVFIDARVQDYIDYIKTIFDDNILVPKGTVIIDNGLLWGLPYLKDATFNNGLAMRRTNDYLKSRPDLFKVLVPFRDGMWIVRKMRDTYLE